MTTVQRGKRDRELVLAAIRAGEDSVPRIARQIGLSASKTEKAVRQLLISGEVVKVTVDEEWGITVLRPVGEPSASP